EHGVEGGHRPGLRRWHAEALAHVSEPALADPSAPRLQRLQRGEQLIPPLSLLAAAARRVGVAARPARASVPRRARRAQRRIDRRSLLFRRRSLGKPKVHSLAAIATSRSM